MKTKWECDSCKDPERSSESHKDKTWGHIGNFRREECMARCEGMDGCDGIQIIEFEKQPNRAHSPRPVKGIKHSQILPGLPCQWLRKPKKSHACKHDDKYKTCWRKEEDDDGIANMC